MKIKIQIKSIFGKILFELEKEENTVKETLLQAIKEGADLRSANLRSANLYGADLYGADLEGADLRSANLYGANLYGADLRSANLYGADLRSADLRSANLRSANLYGADLYGADLEGADLRSAKNIKEAYLPIYAKWGFAFKDGILKIGCKEKTIPEWDIWFSGSEEYDTPRSHEDF